MTQSGSEPKEKNDNFFQETYYGLGRKAIIFLRDIRFESIAGILTLWAFVILPPTSFAQIDGGNSVKLRVGTVVAPPYAVKTAGGTWEGFSIDLWQAVASMIGVHYDVKEYGTFDQLVDVVANEKLDVAIGLAGTEQREAILDLSHPYYQSGLAIAVPKDSVGRGWSGFAGGIEIARIIKVVVLLILLWLIAGAAVWAFERRRNREMYGEGPINGIGQAVWWAAVTMTTVGYGDKAPKTLGGRIVAVVWMLASIVFIAGFTATISASLTAVKLTGKVRGLQDLPHVRVGTVTQSEPVRWLVDHGITPTLFSSEQDGLQAIVDDRIDAFVFDEIVLKYTVKNDFLGRVHVLAETFDHYYLCMGLPIGSALRKPINAALLKLMETRQWDSIVERYIGSSD